jgi:hypothetical protein
VIFDEYTTRLRALQFTSPGDAQADELLLHDADRVRADRAIAEVDQLSGIADLDSRPLARVRVTTSALV